MVPAVKFEWFKSKVLCVVIREIESGSTQQIEQAANHWMDIT